MTGLDPASWLDRYGDLLYGYALSRVRDKTLAEDLVQEALLAAIASVDTFKGDSKESTWLVGILRHKVLDHFRKLSREQRGQDDWRSLAELKNDEFDEQGAWKTAVPVWSNPEKTAEQAEFWPIVNQCVGALPEKLGVLFALREIDGIDAEQLADTLNISTKNNLWVMLSRARQHMRRCLQSRWFEHGGQGTSD
jgi:RNA polymerase sigma-70 factor (ECF subfamily)